MKWLSVVALFLASSALAPSAGKGGAPGIREAAAVKAPTEAQRKKAGTERQEDLKAKAKAQCASGCRYGKDRKTGKCYEPREGQTYFDCQDAKYHIRKIEKVNTPWGRDRKSTDDQKKDEKKKEEKVKKKTG